MMYVMYNKTYIYHKTHNKTAANGSIRDPINPECPNWESVSFNTATGYWNVATQSC
jgi:hypothetical protein